MPVHLTEKEYRQVTRQQEAPPAPPDNGGSPRVVPSSPRRAPGGSYRRGKDNYWTFVFGATVILLLAYLAGHGKLKDFINILIPAAAPAPKIGTPSDQSPAGAVTSGAPITPANIVGNIGAGKSLPESISGIAPMVNSGIKQVQGLGDAWDWVKKQLGF